MVMAVLYIVREAYTAVGFGSFFGVRSSDCLLANNHQLTFEHRDNVQLPGVLFPS